MNDIDIEELRMWLARRSRNASMPFFISKKEAAALAAAIETGRQWETIARRLADCLDLHLEGRREDDEWVEPDREALAAFRDLADRTPTPTDGP